MMPPGVWHQVFTPVKTVASGGQFLTYDALHLTEVARAFDKKQARMVTNASHESVFPNLCGMLVGLFRQSRTGEFSAFTGGNHHALNL